MLVLALVCLCAFSVQVDQVDSAVDRARDKNFILVECEVCNRCWMLLNKVLLDAEGQIDDENGTIDESKSKRLPFLFATLVSDAGYLIW